MGCKVCGSTEYPPRAKRPNLCKYHYALKVVREHMDKPDATVKECVEFAQPFRGIRYSAKFLGWLESLL